MSALTDERLCTLSEIAADCFDVDLLDADAPEQRVLVKPADIVRALESAYDVGLVVGYQLTRSGRIRS
ncbi:hypothetical protein [Paraburkholderia hospita]|jgi:hypothetical protein|uniref:Uncharacterized protein n=1 Tax=Paraburkholderia hospita TaxID=169430 RepID=A0AAJ4SY32_9BURK|nr:hypothetical protein [Paraburkholderia hospita]SKC89873.1 hypothetical protein SAMN05445504_5796 [Burkholderia sp. CF099]SOE90377.1 hypothetical protein SAMN05446935_9664 [Burkholderia sp. YR290]AUT71333.1 hypothetical protein C2L64_23925 [Paraburkholderia hospita]AXF02292.1 hypothetical protein CUJ88_28630 [Paraburkholderia hospita]EIM94222.1 hypothetical protein WQE_44788 [Paraburkholderia hospita]